MQSRPAHKPPARLVAGVVAVAHVEADHTHAGVGEAEECGAVVAGRAHSRHDLGAPRRGVLGILLKRLTSKLQPRLLRAHRELRRRAAAPPACELHAAGGHAAATLLLLLLALLALLALLDPAPLPAGGSKRG